MPLSGLLHNPVFIATLVTSFVAQVLKLPLSYLQTREWNFSLLFSTGGMPSSHSAVVTAAAAGVGYYTGFNTPLFGLAFAIAVVVIYDATNIRRQPASAQQINRLLKKCSVVKSTGGGVQRIAKCWDTHLSKPWAV